jgi:hypothetical protein
LLSRVDAIAARDGNVRPSPGYLLSERRGREPEQREKAKAFHLNSP